MNSASQKYLKNTIISTCCSMLAGILSAYIYSMLTQSKAIISITSIVSQYTVGTLVFLMLHAHSYPEKFRIDNGRFNWKIFIKDASKIGVAYTALNYSYSFFWPLLHYSLQCYGYTPVHAVIISDAIGLPLYWVSALLTAKAVRII